MQTHTETHIKTEILTQKIKGERIYYQITNINMEVSPTLVFPSQLYCSLQDAAHNPHHNKRAGFQGATPFVLRAQHIFPLKYFHFIFISFIYISVVIELSLPRPQMSMTLKVVKIQRTSEPSIASLRALTNNAIYTHIYM